MRTLARVFALAALAWCGVARSTEPAARIVTPAEGESFTGSLVVQVELAGIRDEEVLEAVAHWWDAPAQKLLAPPWRFRLRAPAGAPNGKPQRVRVVVTLKDGRKFGDQRMVVPVVEEATVVRRILVPLSAVKDGRPVTDLAGSELSLQVDGKSVRFNEFIIDERPISLVVAIDTSGSMADQKRLEQAQAAAMIFFDQLKPDDRVALFDFNDEVYRLVPLGPPSPEYPAAVKSLEAKGATSLWEALDLARPEVQGGSRRAVILITDADGRGIDATRMDAARTAEAYREGDVVVFAVFVGSSGGSEAGVVEKIALAGGGHALRGVAPAELPAAARAIVAQLRTQYLLSFTPPGAPDGRSHSIVISTRRDGVELRHRRVYIYGADSAAPPAPKRARRD